MKDYLKNLIARKNTELANLKKRNEESTDINEVKTIGSQIESVNAEINEAEKQLAAVEADEAKEAEKETEEARSAFNPNAALNVVSTTKVEARSEETDELSSMEYRKAFMNYVQRGVKSDILKFEKRDGDDVGVATDLGVLLPKTVMQEIITGVEKVYGQLYARVRKTNIKGGVRYPIGSFGATFKRIAETGEGAAPSDRQNAGSVNGYVQFSYNIGEIRIARTLLQSVLSVPAFEKEVAKVIVEAYVKAMDKEIMTGDSSDGEMEGILTEAAKVSSRIPASNIIEFTEADMADWTKWQEKLFAVIPLSMRGLRPQFAMTANTYEANIKTLKDDNNRPVYNETFNPVDGSERATFKGKEVAFVEEDILANFNDASDGDYFGMYWVPEEAYAINSNMEFTMMRYFDQEKNEYVDKALVINDGKVLDPKYIYLLKKVDEITA